MTTYGAYPRPLNIYNGGGILLIIKGLCSAPCNSENIFADFCSHCLMRAEGVLCEMKDERAKSKDNNVIPQLPHEWGREKRLPELRELIGIYLWKIGH